MRTSRRLAAQFPLALVLVASIVAWLPLVLAGETPAAAATTPVPDQRSEMQISTDVAGDARLAPQQMSAPFFMPLCKNERGRWAQTFTAGMTARLSEIELRLLRRSPSINAPVEVEIRAVDEAGLPTATILAHGSTAMLIPSHWSESGWLTVPLDQPIMLRSGQKVAIFPTAEPSASGACYEWVSSGLDLYAGGAIATTHDGGVSFVPEGGMDVAFRTWMR